MGLHSLVDHSFQESVCVHAHVCVSPKRGTSTSAFGLTPAFLQPAAVQITLLTLRLEAELVTCTSLGTGKTLGNHEIT